MKKRVIALLLCAVMLVTCMGVGVDVLNGDEDTAAPAATEEPAVESDLYSRFMACTTQAEMNAIVEELGEEQVTAQLTEEQLIAIEEYYSSLAEGSSESEQGQDSSSYVPAVNFTNVAPLLDPVKGSTPRKAAQSASRASNDSSDTDKGMKFDKTATDNGDGTYTIQLEAYATGSKVISEITEDIPTDIVLVLDQSGSMADCIVCGETNCEKHYDVGNPVYSVDTGKYYYAYIGSKYVLVKYCEGNWGISSGHHTIYIHDSSWVPANLDTSGGGNDNHQNYVKNNGATFPKQSANDNQKGHVQFYEAVQSTRLKALKEAVTTFTNAVAQKAAGKDGNINTTADNINHRIAIVGFASGTDYGYNTELLSIKGTNSGNVGIRYGSIEDQDYIDVLQSMDTASGKTMVSNAINALAANGGTETDLGIEMANRILSANPVESGEQRNRVVVVFTDGAPGDYGNWNSNSVTTANNALKYAKETKGTYKATVYTVGVFSGADASNPSNLPSYTKPTPSDANAIKNSNRFMHLLSSNYPNATDITTPGAINSKLDGSSYYLSAGDSASLNDIFKQISKQIEDGDSFTTLDSNTVIKDAVSDAFKLPDGATASDITLETYKYNGGDSWTANHDAMGAKATVNAETGEVSVTGFNFKENYVADIRDADGNLTGEKYRGNKLVISFKVEAKDGFLGGNGVYTNTDAGIYGSKDAEKATFTFNKPTVDVAIKSVEVTASEKNVYLLGGLTADQLKSDSTIKVGDVALNLNADNYGLEAWQNEYVDITVTIKDKSGNVVTGLDKLSDDQTYSLTVTVSPKSGSGAKSGTATANISVFKPELTYKDSAIDLGQTPDYEKENFVSEKWKHGSTYSTEVTMTGTEPTLDFSYDPAAKAFTEDTPVKVTVKINGENVTSKVTFLHEKCDYTGCDFNADKCNFIVHIKTFDLTITKRITTNESNLYGERNFVFTITAADGTKIQAVVNVKAGETTGSTTIKGLPVDTYTITEDTAWSWRYTLEGVAAATDVQGNLEYTSGNAFAKYTPSDGTHNEVVFTNSLTNYYWLSFVDSVRNFFNAK